MTQQRQDIQLQAVQRMQDYISSHLQQEITLADLARAAAFSPFYSARLFKELTGMTPGAYIRRLRLSASALRLRDGEEQVTEEAFANGFDSVEGYQRAFRRLFGLNPSAYVRNKIPLPLFTPYGVKFRNLWKEPEKMDQSNNIFIQIIDRPACKAMIKRGRKATDYWEYCQEVGCDVWGLLVSMAAPGEEPVCLWLPAAYRRAETSTYVQGVTKPSDYQGPVPEGFDMIGLPSGSYMMFQGAPYDEQDYCQAISAVQQAMDAYDPSVVGYRWDDSRPRIQLEPCGRRGYIEMRAVRRI